MKGTNVWTSGSHTNEEHECVMGICRSTKDCDLDYVTKGQDDRDRTKGEACDASCKRELTASSFSLSPSNKRDKVPDIDEPAPNCPRT